MRRWTGLLSLLAATACSGLDEGEGGVVAIEVEIPAILALEVGEQQQVVARALDADGAVVDAAIGWQATTAAVTVNGEGIVTAAEPGEAEVQATVGSLGSERIPFEVTAPADTLMILGDSVVIIPAASDPPATATLQVRLESFTFPEPLSGRPVIFAITSPTPTVQLGGGVESDTVSTSAEAVASVAISAGVGQVPPDTAIVEVRAERARGAPVPGSGQRFIVLFQ